LRIGPPLHELLPQVTALFPIGIQCFPLFRGHLGDMVNRRFLGLGTGAPLAARFPLCRCCPSLFRRKGHQDSMNLLQRQDCGYSAHVGPLVKGFFFIAVRSGPSILLSPSDLLASDLQLRMSRISVGDSKLFSGFLPYESFHFLWTLSMPFIRPKKNFPSFPPSQRT